MLGLQWVEQQSAGLKQLWPEGAQEEDIHILGLPAHTSPAQQGVKLSQALPKATQEEDIHMPERQVKPEQQGVVALQDWPEKAQVHTPE